MTEINAKVNSVLNQLPSGAQQPTLSVKIGQTIDSMYIGFSSDVVAPNQITDYLIRVVQPKLQAVPGVQTAELIGNKTFALRAWIDPPIASTKPPGQRPFVPGPGRFRVRSRSVQRGVG